MEIYVRYATLLHEGSARPQMGFHLLLQWLKSPSMLQHLQHHQAGILTERRIHHEQPLLH